MWRIIFRNDSFYIPCMERLNKKKKRKKKKYIEISQVHELYLR